MYTCIHSEKGGYTIFGVGFVIESSEIVKSSELLRIS